MMGEDMNSILFDYIVDHFGTNHIFWTFYVLNVIFSVIAYKLGFARKLPLFKSLIVYVLLILGVFIITVFSVFRLAMTESLIIISAVLGIYRFRLHQERTKREE